MKRKPTRVKKEPIDPRRLRKIPAEGFSWIDRRFVREGFIERLAPGAAFLYFFLVTASDAEGLSFYADSTISRNLKLSPQELSQARARLMSAELILYRYPIYQVLALPKESPPERSSSLSAPRGAGGPVSLGELLELALKEAAGGRRTNQDSKE